MSLTQYQEKSEKAHILENPDTYTGSIENVIMVLQKNIMVYLLK